MGNDYCNKTISFSLDGYSYTIKTDFQGLVKHISWKLRQYQGHSFELLESFLRVNNAVNTVEIHADTE